MGNFSTSDSRSHRGLTFGEYQARAWSTTLPSAQNDEYLLYGLIGEVGELMQHIAKAIRDYDGTVSEDIMCKELGDILWFVACVAHHNGFDLSDIAAANLAKLADRQRRGVIGGSGDNR